MISKETVAVLGAGGTMGFAMARNLARDGFEVRAWNRSREKAEPLSQDGAEVFDSPAQAVAGADVILTMLADVDAVIDAMRGDGGALSADLPARTIWLQMSTIGEAAIERCIALAREHDLELVDAPVLGTKQPAEEGKLVVLASGPEPVRDRVQPIFAVVGQRSMWVGEAGAGTRLKLATNGRLVTVVEGCAESLALAEGFGLDPQLLLDAVAGGPLDLPYLQMKGKAMIERRFDPSFKLKLAAKDAALVDESARRHDLDLPLVKTIHERLEQAAREYGDEDLSATFRLSAPR
ncbi:MAG: NAD(P)-dependent oxidoreductase [Actinomycetota bacterium]|nr:NAD(P)-dependent oxidoreductase [Actinomycetota bacterium]